MLRSQFDKKKSDLWLFVNFLTRRNLWIKLDSIPLFDSKGLIIVQGTVFTIKTTYLTRYLHLISFFHNQLSTLTFPTKK